MQNMQRLRSWVLGFIIFIVYRILSFSWRIEYHEEPIVTESLKNKTSFVFAHFHGDELALLSLASRYRLSTMVSTSSDGELMNVVYNLIGGKSSRGSSTRGSVAGLKGLIKLCKQGRNPNLAVDGPKGPLHIVKPGIFELSRIMNSPIVYSGVHCESAWRFPKSWNQAYLPKPFARVIIFCGGPFGPVGKDQDPRSEELAKALQNQLFDAKSHAANLFGLSGA